MAVQCPYCRHELALKAAPPGMYTTACTYCERKFYLAVPEDPRQQPVAAPIPAERESVKRSSQGEKTPSAPPDRADKIESRATESPVLTLPEPARSTATLPGPGGLPTGLGDQDRLPAVAARSFAWSRLGIGSVRRLVGGYLVLRELGRIAPGAGVPGEAIVARPRRELEGHEAAVGQERSVRCPVHA